MSEVGAPASPTITSGSLSGSVATLGWYISQRGHRLIIGYGSSAGPVHHLYRRGQRDHAGCVRADSTAVDYFAVYAYNASTARSLPSANVRLAPYSTDPERLREFPRPPVIDNESSPTPVSEPLVESNYAFTSLGNAAGKGLLVMDSGDGYYPLHQGPVCGILGHL